MNNSKRRQFLKKLSLGGIIISGIGKGLKRPVILQTREFKGSESFSTNNQIQLAIIGCGIQGQINARIASRVEGLKIVAACDLYQGRLDRMIEDYDDLYTTRDIEKF